MLFKEMLKVYTAKQIQWIIRIILKDMRIHCGEKLILNAVHKGAYDAWTTNKSLYDICQLGSYLLEGQTKRMKQELKLFYEFVPQTAIPFSDKYFEQLEKPFYVQKKIDGERVLMHYDRDQDRFLWHSRNRVQENTLYGDSSKDNTKLSSYIQKGILVKNIILDGEMVAHSVKDRAELPFGTLKTAAKTDLSEWGDTYPCYYVFDILMVNGLPLIGHTLKERLRTLYSVVKEQEPYLKILPSKEMQTKEQVMDELEKALLNKEEGLVLKDKSSCYHINKKSSKWIKFKPSFLDTLVDTCDLVLVGIKYGYGKKGGKIGSLLCAVRDDTIPDTEPPRFITFALPGTGLRNEDIIILTELIKTISDYDPKKTPDWLDHPLNGKDLLDQIVHYQDSIVVEVKGAFINDTQKFGMKCTLRFPTFIRIRKDKGWQDIMTYTDVLKAKAEGGVGKKRTAEDRIEKSKVRKTRRGTILLPSQQGLDSSPVIQKTNIFEGTSFYVINGTKLNEQEEGGFMKNELDYLIKENGGEYRQNKSADILIAGVKNARVNSIITVVKTRDIILPSYILDSIEARKMLSIEPKYMLYTSSATQEKFLQSRDIYGDIYNKKILAKEFIEITNRMKTVASTQKETMNKALELVDRYFPEGIHGMLFINTRAYFDFSAEQDIEPQTIQWTALKKCQEELEIAKSKYVFESGQVVSKMTENITHIIIHKDDVSRVDEFKKWFLRRNKSLPRFVTLDWINKCYHEEVRLNEEDFQPKSL
ncbi:ATP dependent DNA ligase domain-containing protein [Cokeromyces recurvatus]|uniref:ATP dependent DNA ligase domain-containing protein n=1 Tax=Cokeromyces recurvatus TaxID=90255 RepID=UPI00221F6F6C|nr:ATP dependent DNA ligase domain-containing protein [Cokeromyces recurvatus]KAI7899247.1 ATP dependent DNA ligase domain-containing protein [Cokeromyces recurvatus]